MQPTALTFLTLAIVQVAIGLDIVPDPRWIEESLRRHNEFRRGFDAPPLKLNEGLCKSSLIFARELAKRDSENDLEHSDMGYGENIYRAMGKGVEIYGTTPVDRWYDEIENYLKLKEKDNETLKEDDDVDEAAVGSFTQLVWKATTDMCISYAASEPDENENAVLYIVAHYLPRGNTDEEEDNINLNINSPYFYPDSDSAPQRRHLSDPIGSNGGLISGSTDHPERNCWNDWSKFDRNAEEVKTPGDFIEAALNVTNALRQKHHVRPLPMLDEDCTLCRSAQGWADAMAQTPPANWTEKEESTVCSQMIFVSKELVTAQKLIVTWYSEGRTYEYYHHRTYDGMDAGNFLRLLWKGVEQFCVAYAKNTEGDYIYVGLVYNDPKPKFDLIQARQKNIFNNAGKYVTVSNFLLISLIITSLF